MSDPSATLGSNNERNNMQTIIFPAPEIGEQNHSCNDVSPTTVDKCPCCATEHRAVGEILVRVFDNGTATMSYRERPASSWSAPTWGEVQA